MAFRKPEPYPSAEPKAMRTRAKGEGESSVRCYWNLGQTLPKVYIVA
jgi:hypothetical protein